MNTPIVWERFAVALLSFFAFGLFHSLCAQEAFKERLGRLTSDFFVEHFWRLLYCLISWFLLYEIFFKQIWISFPRAFQDQLIFPLWYNIARGLIGIIGVGISYAAFLQFDYFEFWGLKQVGTGLKIMFLRFVRGIQWAPPRRELSGVDRFEARGIYKVIRHPMLVGGFLISFSYVSTIVGMIYLCLFTLYMVIGGYYEERRLIKNLGSAYTQYMNDVGGFLPKIRRANGRSLGEPYGTNSK